MKTIPVTQLPKNPLSELYLSRVAEVEFELPALRDYIDACERLYSDTIGLVGRVVKCIRHANGGFVPASPAQIEKFDNLRGQCPFRLTNQTVFYRGESPVMVAQHADGQRVEVTEEGRPAYLGVIRCRERLTEVERLDRQAIMAAHYDEICTREAIRVGARQRNERNAAQAQLAHYTRTYDRYRKGGHNMDYIDDQIAHLRRIAG